jgi:hypothetical protein
VVVAPMNRTLLNAEIELLQHRRVLALRRNTVGAATGRTEQFYHVASY